MITHISGIDDPGISAFFLLQDSTSSRRRTMFVAEGEFLVRRLLASRYPVHAVLLEQGRLDSMAEFFKPETPVYLASQELLSRIVGFHFHRGVIALGLRQPPAQLRGSIPGGSRPLLLVICPEMNDEANLGVVLRNSAAFGIDGVLLGSQCCDPFARRAVRTSMGAVFNVPIYTSPDLASDLAWLRSEQGFQLAAAVLDASAMPLQRCERRSRMGVLFGTEARGLSSKWIQLCDVSLTVPMRPGTDSLNVGVAAGIVLYHFTLPRQ